MRANLALLLIAVAGPARAELLFEVFAGKSFTEASDLVLRQPARSTDVRYGNVAFSDQSLRSPPYYGYRVTYFPRQRSPVGAGLEFVHFKAIARTDRAYGASGLLRGAPAAGARRLDETVQSFEVSHGMNLLTANVQVRPASGSARPYAGLGAGISIPHAESVVEGRGGPSRYEVSSHPALQAFAGVRGALWRDLIAFGEYKFSYARLETAVDAGTVEVVFPTHHVIFGAGYRLGR